MEEIKRNEKDAEKPTSEHFAMEILKQEQGRSKAKDKGVIALGIVTGISIFGIAATAMFMSNVNYQNDREWRELFNSYEFITQDGGGENYYNSEIGGNVNNGAKDNEKEEQNDR